MFQYYFDHRSSVNPWPNWTGVLHGDEVCEALKCVITSTDNLISFKINFIFGEPLNESMGYSEEEKKLARDIMTYWANFAKTGNPSLYPNGTWTKVYWPMRSPYQKEYLILRAKNMTADKGYNSRKCAFWDSYLPSLLGMRYLT